MVKLRLADIAARTGVTVPTVSKVLNGRTDVAPETRARIIEILDESGYKRRSVRARSASEPKSAGFIDLILNSVGKSWAIEVLGGVHTAARAAGCDLVVTYSDPGAGSKDWVDRVVNRGSRGVVIERLGLDASQKQRLAAARIPCVIIDPGAEPPPGVLSVGAASWSGGYAAAQHLISLGHTKLAVIGGGLDTMASRARLDGFKSALTAAGIDLDPRWERQANWTRSGARVQANAILGVADRPTAIFACSDRMAAGVYQSARELGISIPDDLSVVGFDNLPEVRWLTPELTTIGQPVEEMGFTALQLILTRNRGDWLDSERIELSTTLVVRGSTAAPAQR